MLFSFHLHYTAEMIRAYCLKVEQCGCGVSAGISSFPRGAAPSIHLRLHVVQRVSQGMFDDCSPPHVTHLSGVQGKTLIADNSNGAQLCTEISSHRLVLHVLRWEFKMWPKVDRNLKRQQFKFDQSNKSKSW